jgi:glycogen(starch) synthase
MRVLFWSELFWPHIGGAEIFATNLLQALQERGYEFLVVTRQDSPDLLAQDCYKGIQISRFPFWTALVERTAFDRLLAVRQQVIELKRSFAPDLIHIHGPGPTNVFFHLNTSNAYPTRLLLTLINELPSHVAEANSVKRVLRSADWVTGKATTILNQARYSEPNIISRSSVIPNGLDTIPVLPELLPFQAPRLLCLGRLVRQKGFDLALAAFASIIDRFPEVRMSIAGDGPERSQLERQIAEWHLEGKVELLGWVAPDNVPALLNTATMVLMPSRWEGLPSVALQTAMMARPVVATSVGGLSEVIVHQQTGLLVPPENHAELASAIAFLLEHPTVAVQMGQNACERVQEVFGWQRCVDAYDALYRQLGGGQV